MDCVKLLSCKAPSCTFIMNKEEVIKLISNILGLEPEEIIPEAHFYEDFNCEPRDMVELKLQLEDVLKNKIDPDEYEKIQTIGDLFELIEEYSDDFID